MVTGLATKMGVSRKTDHTVLLWDVRGNPYHRSEVVEDPGMPDEYEYMIMGLVEVDGDMQYLNLWYQTEEECYLIIKHFKSSPEPLELF